MVFAVILLLILTLVSGTAAGVFGGMWWQSRKTVLVWEKAYEHVRQQLPAFEYTPPPASQKRDDAAWKPSASRTPVSTRGLFSSDD